MTPQDSQTLTFAAPLIPNYTLNGFGTLKWNGSQYEFEGDPHESAKIFAEHLLVRVNAKPDSQTLTADDGLAEQMKAAGMMSIEEMMQPMNRFQVHSGMTDLKFFEQWLERRTEEYVRMFARRTVEKKTDDDMYEWVLAHKAAFHEVLVNFRAALNQGQG